MAGGKGGTTTQRQEIPEWQKKEIMEAIKQASMVALAIGAAIGLFIFMFVVVI